MQKFFPICWCTFDGIHKTISFNLSYILLNSCFEVLPENPCQIIWSNAFHCSTDLIVQLNFLHYWVCKENVVTICIKHLWKIQQPLIETLAWHKLYVSFYFVTIVTIWKQMWVSHLFTRFISKYWNWPFVFTWSNCYCFLYISITWVSVVTVVSVHFDWNAYNGFCPSSICSAELLAASVSILFNSKLLWMLHD